MSKVEERRTNARLVANSELLQMQGALGLDQTQQDKVFHALYAQSERLLSGGGPVGGCRTARCRWLCQVGLFTESVHGSLVQSCQ